MKQSAHKKIVSCLLSFAVLITSSIISVPYTVWAVDGSELGASLGLSGNGENGGEDSEEQTISNPDMTLGQSNVEVEDQEQIADPTLHFVRDSNQPVMDFATLYSILNNTSQDVSIELGADILMTSNINIPANRTVVIDGLNQYQLDQGGTNLIIGNAGTDITLKDITIVGRHYHGIIESRGQKGKATFDHVTYSGPQLYYCSGTDGVLTIKNGGTYHIIKQKDAKGGSSPQEFSETPYVIFDGGETAIYHTMEQGDTNTNSVFYLTNGTGGAYIKLINEASVTIQSGNYVFYTTRGNVPFLLEDGCSLNITAAAFNRSISHRIDQVKLGSNASFSYTQKGTPKTTDSLREMYIMNGIVAEAGSTFVYESSKGLRSVGANVFHSPKLVSIYGSESAFFNATGSWEVNDVNAVNYWEKAYGQPAPVDDAATNWPQYMWNTWHKSDVSAYHIGAAFSFSGAGSSVSSTDDIADVMQRSTALLSDTLQLNTTAQRLVFGTISPFEVERVISAQGIYGAVNSDDIMAQFEQVDGSVKWVTGQTLPLLFHENEYPQPGSVIDLVANQGGLRAGIKTQTTGALELVSTPQTIYYGEHKLPAETTVYHRQYTSSGDSEGEMMVQVVDSRGELGSPWELTLEMNQQQTVPGKQPLPSSILFFKTHSGEAISLSQGAVTVYHHNESNSDYADYKIVWADSEGLLAQVSPGQLNAGSYGAVLNWTVQAVPSQE